MVRAAGASPLERGVTEVRCIIAQHSDQKSPLSPLFQRGVKLQQKTITPLKKGEQGGLRVDCGRYHPSDFLNEV
jgi:hypothetical protein